MNVRQTLGILLLAVLAGVGGVVAGSFLGHRGPPPALLGLLERAGADGLARAWSEASAPAAPAGAAVARVGGPRPDPALVDVDGRPRSLGEWSGRRLLVNFWATWCAPCREEMPALDQVRRERVGSGVEVVGIALDDAEAVRAFLARTPVSYPVLLAPADAPNPALAFGDTRGALPYSVLVGADGRIERQRLGGLDAATVRDWLGPAP